MGLKTRFEVGEIPHSEYPRPQMVRDNYKVLNGLWDFAVVDALIEKPEKIEYEGKILVPFCIESPLSKVNREFLPNQTLVYRTTFKYKAKDAIPLLHFDAVDYKCFVYLNDIYLGSHEGGYFNFSFDISEALKQVGDNELVVLVQDPSDSFTQQRGKQSLKRGGIWYTPTSGIWQSVWLENVPQTYIERVVIKPDIDESNVDITIITNKEVERYSVDINFAGHRVAFKDSTLNSFKVKIRNQKLWSPEEPNLYDITVSAGDDEVKCYFGMRKFELRDRDFYLNNRKYFLTGALDQGYWPDGLLTPPSDEAIQFDIDFAKSVGLNCLRKHIKIEPMRFYYHCDKKGIIVWQDMINGGGQFSTLYHMILPTLGVNVSDNKYKVFGRDDVSRNEFKLDLGRMVKQLYNAPSICLWGIFNEAWGQFDSQKMLEYLLKLDRTRAIDATSGWYNQGNHLVSIHKYILPIKMPKTKRAVALTEFGGYSCPVDGHIYSDKKFGYLMYSNLERLNKAIQKLYLKQVFKAVKLGLNSCIYTQLTDVEDEINGLITYDRKVVKINKDMFININNELKKDNKDNKPKEDEE